MVANVYPSRPAEQVLFRERFTSPASVHANGGTLVGGCVPNHGLPLDGSTQYATFAFPLGLRTEFWAEMVFVPDHAYDDGNFHYLFSSTGDSYRLFKHSDNSLALYLNGTLIQSIASGVYGAYWIQDERNRLLVSTTGSITNAWLNGAQILTNDATGWSPADKVDLVVGSYAGGGGYFSGTYESIAFHEGLLTQADVDAIEDGSLFTYQNRANLWLDMKEQTRRVGTLRGVVQLLADGDMEAAGVAAYTAWSDAVLTKDTDTPQSGAQCLRITQDGTGTYAALQDILTVGKRCRVRGYAWSDGTDIPRVIQGGTDKWVGITTTAWRYFDRVFNVAVDGKLYLRSNGEGGAGGYVRFDNVEVFETDEILSDGDCEETGIGAWTESTATASKVTNSPYQGTQALRVTVAATAGRVQQQVMTIGKRYWISGVARSADGVQIPALRDNGLVWRGDTGTDWQPFGVEWVASGTWIEFWCDDTSAGAVDFDALSIKEMPDVTLDKSPHGHVVMLGDGHTASTQPSFLNPGFDLDGSSDYLFLPQASGIFNNAGQSFVCAFRPDFAPGDGVFHYLMDSTAGSRYLIAKDSANQIQVYMGNTSIIVAVLGTYSAHWRTKGVNILVVVGTSGATSVFLNGALVASNSGAWTPANPSKIYLGASNSFASPFDGEYLGCMGWPFKLSPIQARDLTISLGVNV